MVHENPNIKKQGGKGTTNSSSSFPVGDDNNNHEKESCQIHKLNEEGKKESNTMNTMNTMNTNNGNVKRNENDNDYDYESLHDTNDTNNNNKQKHVLKDLDFVGGGNSLGQNEERMGLLSEPLKKENGSSRVSTKSTSPFSSLLSKRKQGSHSKPEDEIIISHSILNHGDSDSDDVDLSPITPSSQFTSRSKIKTFNKGLTSKSFSKNQKFLKLTGDLRLAPEKARSRLGSEMTPAQRRAQMKAERAIAEERRRKIAKDLALVLNQKPTESQMKLPSSVKGQVSPKALKILGDEELERASLRQLPPNTKIPPKAILVLGEPELLPCKARKLLGIDDISFGKQSRTSKMYTIGSPKHMFASFFSWVK